MLCQHQNRLFVSLSFIDMTMVGLLPSELVVPELSLPHPVCSRRFFEHLFAPDCAACVGRRRRIDVSTLRFGWHLLGFHRPW
jgi:hypothetical protein